MTAICVDEQQATMHRQNQIRSELLLRALQRHHAEVVVVNDPPAAPPTIVWQETSPEYKELWFGVIEEIEPVPQPVPMIEDVKRVVCKHFGITANDLLSRRNTNPIVRPRMIAMYLSSKFTRRSLPEIGRRFDGMDHTTVLNAVRRIEILCRTDWKIAHDVAHLEARFQ